MLVTIALENFNRIERWEDSRLTLIGGRKLSGALDPLKIYYQERQKGDGGKRGRGDAVTGGGVTRRWAVFNSPRLPVSPFTERLILLINLGE